MKPAGVDIATRIAAGAHTQGAEDFRETGETITLYLTRPAAARAQLRLFCLHHAGGGASAFAAWEQALGPDIDALPVQLPGREQRAGEPRYVDMATLVADLNRQLDIELRAPHAFYGHSMGAIVARHRVLAGQWAPHVLIAGACPAPHLRPALAAAGTMTDEELARVLVDLGGMSETLLRYPAWLRSAVALVRDDLRIMHSVQPSPADGVPPCPVHALAGSDDKLLAVSTALAWRGHTRAEFSGHELPGGHFFMHESPTESLTLLRTLLAPHVVREHRRSRPGPRDDGAGRMKSHPR